MSQLSTHISKLRNQADLVSTGISSEQASRIVFANPFITVRMAKTYQEQMDIISNSLTNCIKGMLRMVPAPVMDAVTIGLEHSGLNVPVRAIYQPEAGDWELETGTFTMITIEDLSFDDRLIFLSVVEAILE